jgi:hypothetical protein
MKTNFVPQLQFDALSLAAGATQFGIGALQSLIGGFKARKAQKQLEGMQSPEYKKNQGILDYYNQALSRYNVSPTDSAMYKRQMNNIGRGVATGISSLQDRRSGQTGISSILRAQNDASLNAEVAAESQKNQRFGELGNATNMKAGEDRTAFQINEVQPFERKYNLLSMKAGAANQTSNTGISNAFNGLQSLANMGMYNKEFGGDNANRKRK